MKQSFRQIGNDYLSFMHDDRKGIIILAILIVILILGNIVIDRVNLIPESDFTEIKKSFEYWNQQKEIGVPKALFRFDPNTIAESKLDCLDVPDFVKRNILRYRAAGGKFQKSADLRKIYGMNDSIFHVLLPCIWIEETDGTTSSGNLKMISFGTERAIEMKEPAGDESQIISMRSEASIGMPKIELNAADSAGLTSLYGIGPVFASRIIKYRNLLGGYYAKEQLLEVYGLREETYMLVSGYLSADTALIVKLRINFDGYRELIRHPYLEKQHVEAILKYRSQHGPFDSAKQVLEGGLLDSAVFVKIRPYLSCR